MYGKRNYVKLNGSAKAAKGAWILLAAIVLGVWVPGLSYGIWRMWRDNKPDVMPRVDLEPGHNLVYELERLRPQQAVWFTYPTGSERIRFALQRDLKGTIRTVVASCMVCYAYRDHHEFKKGQLMCARCRHPMRLGDPNETLTSAKGCVAVPVPFSVHGQLLAVRTIDMEETLRELQPTKPGQ